LRISRVKLFVVIKSLGNRLPAAGDVEDVSEDVKSDSELLKYLSDTCPTMANTLSFKKVYSNCI